MKNRLLEDIGDSQSGPSALAERRPRQAAPPPEPLEPPAPPGTAPQPRARAAVWRSRATLPPAPAADLGGQDTPAPPEPPARPPPHAAAIPPWPASFSSREPDWPIPPPNEPAPWLDRWGRKALGWTVAAAAVVAVAGAATWMYRDTQVQSTLAVVAGNSLAKTAAALPAAAPPVAETAPPWTPPPLRMLPPPPVAAAPAAQAPAVAVAAAPVAQAPAMAEPPAAVAPRAAAAPKAKRAPERRVAAVPVKKKPEHRVAAAPPKKARAAPDLSWAARERERLLAQTRAPARPAPPSAQPEPQAPPGQQAGAEGPLSETLRLCRAAGYHAAACMKRGCEATRFGLVCRG